MLGPCEFLITDGNYGDSRCIRHPSPDDLHHLILGSILERHENIEKRLNQLYVLKDRFRHNVKFHSLCFQAVLNVTVLMLNEEPISKIDF